jgi:hypothetical protein
MLDAGGSSTHRQPAIADDDNRGYYEFEPVRLRQDIFWRLRLGGGELIALLTYLPTFLLGVVCAAGYPEIQLLSGRC